MAKTHGKPGPKPIKGKRRDFHILLPEEDGLASAFEQVAKANGGVIAFAEKIIRERPEIITVLDQAKGDHNEQ